MEYVRGGASVQPLYTAWCPFFPNEDAEHDWGTILDAAPTPVTEEFWYRYAEPLPRFIEAVQLLREAVVGSSPGRASSRTSASLELLAALAGGTGPVLERKLRSRHQLRWRSPSLLSTLAIMAMQDLTRERESYRCPCGNIAASTDPKTK